MPITIPHESVTPPVAGSLSAKVGDTFAWVVQRGFSAIGDALANVGGAALGRFLEDEEMTVLADAAPLLNLIADNPDLPPEIKQTMTNWRSGQHALPVIIVAALGALVSAVFGMFVSAIFGRQIEYQINRRVHPARFAPGELALGLQRGAIDSDRAKAHLADQGYLATDLEVIKTLAAPLLNVSEIATAMFRGEITSEDARERLQLLGYSDTNAGKIQALFPVLPGIQDLITMAVKEVFTPEIVAQYGQDQDFPARFATEAAKQGLSPEWAHAYWAAHWDLPSPSQGFEMLHRGLISHDELVLLLRTLDYMPYWRERMIGMSYNPYTRVDTRRMYDTGIIDRAEVKRSYLDQGYDDAHASNLTEWTCRETRQTQKDLTKAELLSGMVYGVMTEADVRTELLALGYSAADVNFEISLKVAQAAGIRRSPDRAVQKGDLTASYISGLMTAAELRAALRTMGYSDEEATLLIQLADVTKTKPQREANKSLVKSELLTAYRDRLIDKAKLTTSLTEIGYDEAEVGFMVSLADFQVEGDRIDDQVSTLHVLYVNGFKTYEQVVSELGQFNLPDTTTQNLLYKWSFELKRNAVHPTLAQLIQFNKSKIIQTSTLQSELMNLGYSGEYIKWFIELIKRQTTPTSPPGGWQYIA
jgi:hypothetical protein